MDGATETLSGEEITCRELIEFLREFLDGELSPRQVAIFDAHLRICPDCVNYVASYRTTLALERVTIDDPAPPAPLPEELVRAILASRSAD